MAAILPTEIKGSTVVHRRWFRTKKGADNQIVLVLFGAALLPISGVAFYVAPMLMISQNLNVDAKFAIVAVCNAAATLGIAILVERQTRHARTRQMRENCIVDFETEPTADEIASLRELDELLGEQEPYFRTQLAIALRDKARHFPIRTSDIDGIRSVLETDGATQQSEPNPQVRHLNKIISELDNDFV